MSSPASTPMTLTGADTLVLGQNATSLAISATLANFNISYTATEMASRALTSLANGDWGKITFPNDSAAFDVGKNGNTIIAFDNKGIIADMTVRILRGSDDDAFLNQIYISYIQDPVSFVALSGYLKKYIGDGTGINKAVKYTIKNGVIIRPPDLIGNSNGSIDQAVSVYTIKCICQPANV